TRPAMIKNLIDKKLVDYIAMDIKSPIDKYSDIVSRPVFGEAIRQSIKIIMSSGIDYEFRTTVVKSLLTPKDMENIVKEIKGAKRYYLQKFNDKRILNPQFKNKVTYTDDEFKKFKEKFKKYVKECEIR
ncbi:MAG TPA: anaerobic ribonucleoside-triphosphate reductase activating protein, partial [Candidatus Paceibacterota bacterium]